MLGVALLKRSACPTFEVDGCGGSKDGKGEGDGSKVEAHVELVGKAVVRRAISLGKL